MGLKGIDIWILRKQLDTMLTVKICTVAAERKDLLIVIDNCYAIWILDRVHKICPIYWTFHQWDLIVQCCNR